MNRHFLFSLLAILAIVPLVGIVGARVETLVAPVLIGVSDEVAISGNVISIETRFNKVRHCPVEVAVHDFKPESGEVVPARTEGGFNRSNGGVTRLSRTYLLPRAGLEPGYLRRTLYYRCHPLWLTPHRFADVRVE